MTCSELLAYLGGRTLVGKNLGGFVTVFVWAAWTLTLVYWFSESSVTGPICGGCSNWVLEFWASLSKTEVKFAPDEPESANPKGISTWLSIPPEVT